MSKIGQVFCGNRFAGKIFETDEGYEFVYDEAYVNAGGSPISLTLPVKTTPYTSKVLFPFFDGLIPEGWLLNTAIDYWKVKASDRFALLLTTCSDAIGAVIVIPEN